LCIFFFTPQLREEFDTGREVVLTEEHNPHDVAALFKEFFRDLPDPLLTRDLYSAFVATRSEFHRIMLFGERFHYVL
jgi:RhoGAP domain